VLVPATVLEGVLRPALDQRVLQTVVVTGLVLLLPWRRTRPLLVIVLAIGASVPVQLVIGGPLQLIAVACMVLLPYALYRWGSGREVLLGSVVLFGSAAWSAVFRDAAPDDALGGLAVLSAAMAAGAALRYRERERTRALEGVALLERERLARDLHDTVAHHVSAMARAMRSW
jgi:signal transduction histidine kinase